MGGFGTKMPTLAGRAGVPAEHQGDIFQPPVPDDRVAQFYKALQEAREKTGGEPPEWLVNNLVTRYFGESLEQAYGGGQALFGRGRSLDERLGGAADIAMGAGKFAAPFLLPEAVATYGALPVLTGMGVGMGAGAGTEKLAEKAGLGPGATRLAGTLVGGVAGGLAGVPENLEAAGEMFDRLPLGSERGSISFKWKPGTKLKDIPEDPAELGIPIAGKKLTVQDVMRYLNARMITHAGELSEDAAPHHKLSRLLRLGGPELEDQMAQPDPRLDFYTRDTEAADADVHRAFPNLKRNGTKMTIQKSISAAVSKSSNPREEAFNGLRIWEGYDSDGRIPIKQPSGKNWPSQGARIALQNIQRYIDELSERGYADLLRSKVTVGELRELNKNVKGKRGDIVPGSLILGPKIGRYFNDIMGIPQEGSTIDLWAARSGYRRMGRMFRGDKPIAAPLNEADRDVMMDAHRILAERYNLTRNEAQSGEWHYEKGLYRKLGVKDKAYTRSEGTGKYLESVGKPRIVKPEPKIVIPEKSKIVIP